MPVNPLKPRIIYMGTPDFAVLPLKKLIDNAYDIAAVVTVPDKKSGRGQKITQSAVKQFAVEKKIPVLQPENLKSQEFIDVLKEIKPDIIIVVAFRMLPEQVWS
ncbi:MAG TPA: methionyl-tRNA formyltransferase, partial [Bacteroidales bacterium]|nr:methionyl-tRNA formyltransferase [Bacteroidales bacterium]